MRWGAFLERFGEHSVIEPPMVYVGEANPRAIQTQLSRWVKTGKLLKLARGKYVLAPPYRKVNPPLEHVANRLVYPSYVSFERALAWHELIPETAVVLTSATTGRPRVVENALGTFRYRHIHRRLFWGYETVTHLQHLCMIALPEKALLDVLYFQTGVGTAERIHEMRLQNLDRLDPIRLRTFAEQIGVRRLRESVSVVLTHRSESLRVYRLA